MSEMNVKILQLIAVDM